MKNLYFFLLAICLTVTGCDTNKDNQIKYIIGEWKLKKVTIPFIDKSYDYSQYSIVYEFKRNGVLTVSGETDVIDTYIGHTIGKYSYTFIEDKEGYGMVGLPYGLKIDDDTYWYKISSEELTITRTPLDGYAYYLVKLK